MTTTKHPAPTKTGKYWAKWRTSTCDGEWESVCVFADELGEMIGNVWGVGNKHVSSPNFVWGPRIPEPEEMEAMEDVIAAARLVRLCIQADSPALDSLGDDIKALDAIRKGGR